ncbi:MAG: hypothetical protein PHQ43_08865, partial [Dehalococcoidales bacterium]|nr:hypothetical protein [Dehalococcoidales bacterium]
MLIVDAMSNKTNFIYYIFNKLGPRVVTILLLPVYTRYLGPDDYGLVAVLAMIGMAFQRLTNI